MDTNWIGGIVGGLMIGISATMLLLFTGRIAGISGIVGQLILTKVSTVNIWRLLFVAGLLGGATIYNLVIDGIVIQMQASGMLLIVAGLLVGLGTQVGSGCTSGHGVCGVGRRSIRSIVATLIFVGVAIVTVYISGQLNS